MSRCRAAILAYNGRVAVRLGDKPGGSTRAESPRRKAKRLECLGRDLRLQLQLRRGRVLECASWLASSSAQLLREEWPNRAWTRSHSRPRRDGNRPRRPRDTRFSLLTTCDTSPVISRSPVQVGYPPTQAIGIIDDEALGFASLRISGHATARPLLRNRLPQAACREYDSRARGEAALWLWGVRP